MVYENIHLMYMVYENVHLKYMVMKMSIDVHGYENAI